jgi:nucleoside-diphosphate-sugar epimerase
MSFEDERVKNVITGATGYVGFHAALALRREAWKASQVQNRSEA